MRPPPFIRYSLNAAIRQSELYSGNEWQSTQYGYEIRKTKSGLEYRRIGGWENWSDPAANFFTEDPYLEEESDLF
jgi:hypothetical protein